MKRKIWVVSPLMYVMAVIMLVMALFSYKSNKVLFAVEVTISGLAVLSVLLIGMHFRNHVNLAVRSAKRILTAEGEHELNELPLAVAVVGLKGDIIWCNKAFSDVVGGGKDVLGDTILPYIYPRTLRQVSGEKGTSVSTGGKEFTVYTARSENSYVMYFVDDSYFKAIHREYREKKTVISIISFDNREELIRDASGGDESRITAEVEAILREWASKDMGGFVRRLSGGRYLMISDEAHMEQAKQRRFQVLDRVREVKGRNNMSATVSIGIGQGASSTAESETWARQALDMALGRGGDQVAIMKKGDTYEFYGGLSKGIEKRDKVRTRVIAATLSDHIRESDRVYIMGHKNSDLDCVGSAVGMWAAVTKGLGKEAYIVLDKNHTMATPLIEMIEQEEESRLFISPGEAMQDISERALLIVVDTHSYSFVENPDLLTAAGKIVVIDHHRMMVTHIKNSVIFYHEPFASSASEMVAELIQYMENVSISSAEAQALLAGIMLDTKNFILKTGVRTFEASAYLRRKGADTVQVKKLFANSLSTNKEKSELVGSADIYENCAIAYTDGEPTSSTRIAAAQAADELLSIQGVQASFVLFRTGNDVNISARSLGDVNVQVILEAFGGGGHLTMAGAQIKNVTVEEARLALIEKIDESLAQSSNGGNHPHRKEG